MADAARGAVEEQLRRVAPRLRLRWAREDVPAPATDAAGGDYHDVAGTVEAYLDRAYAGQPDRRARLVAAFRSLWDESDESGEADGVPA